MHAASGVYRFRLVDVSRRPLDQPYAFPVARLHGAPPASYRVHLMPWKIDQDGRSPPTLITADAINVSGFNFAPAAVSVADDTISGVTHRLRDHDGPVRVSSSGVLPGGLAAATDYRVRVIDHTTFRFANFASGAIINLTSQGTGTHTLTAGGSTNLRRRVGYVPSIQFLQNEQPPRARIRWGLGRAQCAALVDWPIGGQSLTLVADHVEVEWYLDGTIESVNGATEQGTVQVAAAIAPGGDVRGVGPTFTQYMWEAVGTGIGGVHLVPPGARTARLMRMDDGGVQPPEGYRVIFYADFQMQFPIGMVGNWNAGALAGEDHGRFDRHGNEIIVPPTALLARVLHDGSGVAEEGTVLQYRLDLG